MKDTTETRYTTDTRDAKDAKDTKDTIRTHLSEMDGITATYSEKYRHDDWDHEIFIFTARAVKISVIWTRLLFGCVKNSTLVGVL